jgi:antirestriction protein
MTGEAQLALPNGGEHEVEDDWFEEAEYERWLLSAAQQLGPEWLEQYLEIEAEARDAEEERVPAT